MTLTALIEYLKELRQQRPDRGHMPVVVAVREPIDGTRYEVEVEPNHILVVGNQIEIETP